MPKYTFLPADITVEVGENTKILVAATRENIPIRFGCGACRCGTCAVAIKDGAEQLLTMAKNEQSLLATMKLPTDGRVRLACQARLEDGACTIDLDFQDHYSPDSGVDPGYSNDEYLS